MLRVDQAGEFGATRIYAGQLAVMGARHPEAREIARMAQQEERHRLRFDAMMTERRVRPTALAPVWKGYGVQPQTGRLDHSATVVLVDAKGRQRVGFPYSQLTPEALAHDIRRLTGAASG